MTIGLKAAIQDLTAHPNTEQPLLNVYLDWRTDGSGQRPALRILEQELNRIADTLPAHGPERESFEADRQRMLDYVENEASDDVQGLAIFACDGAGVWTALELHAPVETSIIADHYPHLYQLARLIDDYETCAVVLAEGQESYILILSLSQAERVGEAEAGEEIKRFKAGGQAQMLFQRRTDNVIKAHTKELAEKLERAVRRYQAQHVIVAGNDAIKGIVLDSLPDSLKEKLVDYIHLEITSDMAAIKAAVEPMLREEERQQEQDDIAVLEEQAATRGGLAALGVSATAEALSKGQVQMLLMVQSFGGAGGTCPNCGTLRAGQRARCPYDGAELQPVDLREAFTLYAARQNADLQIVDANPFLEQHEGVGALLRYRDDVQAASA